MSLCFKFGLSVTHRSYLMTVVLSEHSLIVTEGFEQVFNVSKIYVQNYNYRTYNNDIMLIKVSGKQSRPPPQPQSAPLWNCGLCFSYLVRHSWTLTSSQLSYQMTTPHLLPGPCALWAAGVWHRFTATPSHLYSGLWTWEKYLTATGTTGGESLRTCCVLDLSTVEKIRVRYGNENVCISLLLIQQKIPLAHGTHETSIVDPAIRCLMEEILHLVFCTSPGCDNSYSNHPLMY